MHKYTVKLTRDIELNIRRNDGEETTISTTAGIKMFRTFKDAVNYVFHINLEHGENTAIRGTRDSNGEIHYI